MRIIHVSDPHAASPPDSASAFFDKRLLGTLNYLFRRRFLHDQSLMSRLSDFVLGLEPDVVAITGDLTSTGQPREFEAVLKCLTPILDADGVTTLYVPGNHDAYVRDERCAAALAETFSTLNDGASIDDLPYSRAVGDVEFILVNECRPTNIFLSSGEVSPSTADEIERICSEPKKLPRVLLGHFPLKRDLSLRRRLKSRLALAALLENGSMDLSLCGHTHEPLIDVDDSGRGEATAGSFTRTRDVNIVDYSPETDRFKVERAELRD